MRALEVVELTGQPFAASAPRIGAPRWDTVIVGLDCQTTILDERLARRTDLMFDQGLVEEVRTLLRNGLREGVTASRALGYAQVIAALDAGAGADMMRAARSAYLGPAATCDGSGPGFAETTGCTGSTPVWPAHRTAHDWSTTPCGYGGT
ncbi:tRNA delta(2)-isopentenylpyrophosphate transferase [Mycobacterium tuberculosis CAS/NITR204]|uniref:tRNA delta(2)-isopentenylpyrophosphate transferase n=1 Tax=Mycobacterium tuberculosis CAS/NITR204 TaxID=1310114 RepID=R4M8Y9_MYCTX|nr:tRNA delta(2)-isopentenylpyrophosphate transferase [Mycobacterium tuberculosis CAS/NITR204]